jgi:hypothetical protein
MKTWLLAPTKERMRQYTCRIAVSKTQENSAQDECKDLATSTKECDLRIIV